MTGSAGSLYNESLCSFSRMLLRWSHQMTLISQTKILLYFIIYYFNKLKLLYFNKTALLFYFYFFFTIHIIKDYPKLFNFQEFHPFNRTFFHYEIRIVIIFFIEELYSSHCMHKNTLIHPDKERAL